MISATLRLRLKPCWAVAQNEQSSGQPICEDTHKAVSYTHLDVYKRQALIMPLASTLPWASFTSTQQSLLNSSNSLAPEPLLSGEVVLMDRVGATGALPTPDLSLIHI